MESYLLLKDNRGSQPLLSRRECQLSSLPLFTAADRRTNISRELIECLANAHRNEPSPEDVFHYVYAVLHAPSYREKYAEFLRRDFPRVPFPVERDLFVKIASLGVRLAELHLLTSRELDQPSCQFPVQGEMKVAKKKADGFRYDSDMHRMYINKTQYFSPIPPGIWCRSRLNE